MNVFSGNVSSLPLEPVGLDLSSSEATCANLAGPLLQNTGSSQEAVSSHSAGMNRETQPETSLASSWCWSDLVVLCHRFLPSPGGFSSLVSLSLSLYPELVVVVFLTCPYLYQLVRESLMTGGSAFSHNAQVLCCSGPTSA